jgi:prepilin-type N-terminal cleavage/methylation domain-containing protein
MRGKNATMLFLRKYHSDEGGFTLIEILASLVIISVLAAVGIQKYDQISESAKLRVLEKGLHELNSREMVTWTIVKISNEGYHSDAELFATLDKTIDGYRWAEGPNPAGGKLEMQGRAISLARSASTTTSSGRWSAI